MPITPADIQQQCFTQAKRGGYEVVEVDEFLERVGKDVEAMLRKIADLKTRLTAEENKTAQLGAELEKTKAELEQAATRTNDAPVTASGKPSIYTATEEQLSAALIAAQQSADRIVADARANADRICADAENQARKVIRQALDEKQAELDEIERLKTSREQFRTEYMTLVKKFMEAAQANFPPIIASSTLSGSDNSLGMNSGMGSPVVRADVNPYGAQVETSIDDLD